MSKLASVVLLLIGSIMGSVVGYAFGSSENEERFLQLQEQLSKQTKIIKEQDDKIRNLAAQIENNRKNRNLFRKFMWFVFKSDPKLYRAFGELLILEQERANAFEYANQISFTIISEFPNMKKAQSSV